MKRCRPWYPVVIVLDNSNLFIEGQKQAATQQELLVKQDRRFRIDFEKLWKVVACGRRVLRKLACVWAAMEKQGFDTQKFQQREHQGTDGGIVRVEKQVDCALSAAARAAAQKACCVIAIVSGDEDLVVAARAAVEVGQLVEFWSLDKATGREVRRMCEQEASATLCLIQDVMAVGSINHVASAKHEDEFTGPTAFALALDKQGWASSRGTVLISLWTSDPDHFSINDALLSLGKWVLSRYQQYFVAVYGYHEWHKVVLQAEQNELDVGQQLWALNFMGRLNDLMKGKAAKGQ
eukprot:m51a1_g7945 hypothetical protein (293) ;mRNA; f:120047-121703